MDDLISRAAAIGCLGNSPEQMCMPWSEVERMLRELPAVDAVPVVHAEWIHCNGKSHIWYCSNCGGKINYNNAHKTYAKSIKPIEEVNRYCRGCGAKMDGERKEDEER